MLLGVSVVGVICNLVFPEWLITALFAVFLGGNGIARLGKGNEDGSGIEDGKEPLLLDMEMQSREGCKGDKFPWTRVGVDCGVVLLFPRVSSSRQSIWTGYNSNGAMWTRVLSMPNRLIFPTMPLAAGLMGGVFGIRGGILKSPLLFQVGIPPEITSATCSFMVYFSTLLSAIQYVLLGMDGFEIALAFSLTCFVSSNIGIMVVQRAIEKFGRASLIVFWVSIVMALSTILITGCGSIDACGYHVSGRYMGFKSPC